MVLKRWRSWRRWWICRRRLGSWAVQWPPLLPQGEICKKLLWRGSVHSPWLLCGEVRLDQVRWDPQNNLKGSYNHILKVSGCCQVIREEKINLLRARGESRERERAERERRRIIIHTLLKSHLQVQPSEVKIAKISSAGQVIRVGKINLLRARGEERRGEGL